MNIIGSIGKAVSDLTGWYPRGDNQSQSFLSFSNWLRSKVSRKEMLEEYKNLVYSCVSTIAEDVARYEPVVYSEVIDGKPKPIVNHELLRLIENPNAEMSQYELFEATQTYIELTGEAFWYLILGEKKRMPMEVGDVLRPDRMFVVIEKNLIVGYVYKRSDGKEVPFDADEIVHFKKFNPLNQSRGYGPVEAGKLYVDIENETSIFQWGVLKNQAAPAGVLGLKGNITKEAFEKLKKQWKETYSGTSNAGKTLFIRETDATFTKVGLSLQELSIGDMSKVNDEKIRKLFKLSREMLGDTSNSGLGRANIEAIEYVHAKRVIDPKYTRFDDVLTTLLRKYWKEYNTRVSHISHIPKDELAILNEHDKAVDRWMTRNEIRSQRGLGKVEGGDVLYTNFSNIPIDSQQNAETPQVVATTSIKKKVENDRCGEHRHNEKFDSLSKGIKNFFKVLEQIEVYGGRRFTGGLRGMLGEQEKLVLNLVERYTSKGLTKEKGVSFDGTLFELSFDQDAVEMNLLTWLLSAFIKSGNATFESLGKPDAEFLLKQAQRDAIFNSTDRLMKSFNEQTALKLQQQLSQGLESGEGLDKIKARVEAVYEDAKGFRAGRIADTEVHKAVNYANSEVYKSEGYTQLEWVANGDACGYCLAMNGTISEMDQAFVPVGGSVDGGEGQSYVNDYADVKYADLHPNCKCRLMPIK